MYRLPHDPGDPAGMAIDWWYLNDKYPQMGYQVTIYANWLGWDGAYANFPTLNVDMSPVAPEVSVRPGDLCAGIGSYSYGNLGIIIDLPDGISYKPTVIFKKGADSNHVIVRFAGGISIPPATMKMSGKISMWDGNSDTVMLSYVNPNWKPPRPTSTTTSSSTTTTSTASTSETSPNTTVTGGTTDGKSTATTTTPTVTTNK